MSEVATNGFGSNQFFDLEYLSSHRQLFTMEIVPFDYESSEEHKYFHYSSKGYGVIDLYLDISKISPKYLLTIFKRKGYEFLALNGSDVIFDFYRDVMYHTNYRLTELFNIGLSDEKLDSVIDTTWDDYDNGNVDFSKIIKRKKFKFKKGHGLTLSDIRKEVMTFINSKRKEVMNNNMLEVELIALQLMEDGQIFVAYDEIADTLGLKERTVRQYCSKMGLSKKIKEHNNKYFFTHRKDNHSTHQDIAEAGLGIHFEEEFITQVKVSDRIDRPLITVAQNWKPHRDDFKKLNNDLLLKQTK